MRMATSQMRLLTRLSFLVSYCFPFTFVALVTAQYNQAITTVAPGSTFWYPWGANAAGVPLNSRLLPDPNARVTVRSDPPSGILTITTTSVFQVTPPGGATAVPTTTTGSFTTSIGGRSIPTLVYNCEYMPFICRNIQNHIDNHGAYKFDQNGLMKFHVDINDPGRTNRKAVDFRRKETCEKASSPWKKKGFPRNCANVRSDLNINKVVSNNFPNLDAMSVNNMPDVILGPPDITNPGHNLFSGLIWSCDEFPSASWVEGGRGLSNKGIEIEVVCAPMSASCTTTGSRYNAILKAFNYAAGYRFTRNPSEQNWQSSALGGIRAAVIRAHEIQGAIPGNNQGHGSDRYVGAFFLSTTAMAGPTTSRAWVIGERQATKVYSLRSLPTNQPNKKKKRSFIPPPIWATNPSLVIGNSSEAGSVVISGPDISTVLPAPPLTEEPAKPLLRRRVKLVD